MADANGEIKPTPDPTQLTTDALQREVAWVRDTGIERADALAKKLEERINGVEQLHDRKIVCEGEVREKDLKGLEDKFRLVEQQRVEQKQDTKAAVDAALTAQKEAVAEQTTASERSIAKSEATFTKSIEQLQATFNTALDGFRREVADLKERQTAIESQKVGAQEVRTQHGITIGQVIAIAAVLVALLGVVAALLIGAAPN